MTTKSIETHCLAKIGNIREKNCPQVGLILSTTFFPSLRKYFQGNNFKTSVGKQKQNKKNSRKDFQVTKQQFDRVCFKTPNRQIPNSNSTFFTSRTHRLCRTCHSGVAGRLGRVKQSIKRPSSIFGVCRCVNSQLLVVNLPP